MEIQSAYGSLSNNLFEGNGTIDTIKCLFVTGGAGFIGSNFINLFSKKYPTVKIINFDALYYCANENNVDEEVRNSNNYFFIKGNLQNYETLETIFKTNFITHVIHFAAQSHVQNSFDESLEYTKDNIIGTHNLLEVNRLHNKNLIKFIHVSTDEVYGESMLESTEEKKQNNLFCVLQIHMLQPKQVLNY
jgi:dTDP-D-glucose 4,6-dehydratase